jgi:hydroxyacylglutathione hydrolase
VADRFVLGLPLGRWAANCWVVGDRAQGEAVVIDPGEGGAEHLPPLFDRLGVRCTAILLTHGHLDHIWAAPSLGARLDVPVLLHPDDRWLWEQPAAAFGAPPAMLAELGIDRWDAKTDHLADLHDGQTLSFAGVRYRCAHTPGHTPGHVTFLADGLGDAPIDFALGAVEAASDEVLFSGDLLFAGSIGRVDFPRGSLDDMMRSLAATVLPLDDDVLVLSGHGGDTTIGRERATNPFLQQAIAHRA